MIVRERAASSCTETATTPPLDLNIPHLTGSISKPISGIFASISRADNAMPIRPRPMIPTGASGVMMNPPLRSPKLFGLDAGRPGFRGPAGDFAADEGAEFSRRHWRDHHAEAGKSFAYRRRRQDLFAYAVEFVDDRLRGVGGRQQSVPDGGLEARHRLGERRQVRRQFVALRRGHADAA